MSHSSSDRSHLQRSSVYPLSMPNPVFLSLSVIWPMLKSGKVVTKAEFDGLMERKVFEEEAVLPSGKKATGLRWVYTSNTILTAQSGSREGSPCCVGLVRHTPLFASSPAFTFSLPMQREDLKSSNVMRSLHSSMLVLHNTKSMQSKSLAFLCQSQHCLPNRALFGLRQSAFEGNWSCLLRG